MEISEELNNNKNNNEKKKESYEFYLVPIIYIKRALIRIWKFLPSGLSICFNSILYIFYYFLYIIFIYWNADSIRTKK